MKIEEVAELGLFFLKDAVLSVLLEAEHEGEPPLSMAEISQRLGIPSTDLANNTSYYYILRGILVRLEDEGRVRRDPEATHKWQITDF